MLRKIVKLPATVTVPIFLGIVASVYGVFGVWNVCSIPPQHPQSGFGPPDLTGWACVMSFTIFFWIWLGVLVVMGVSAIVSRAFRITSQFPAQPSRVFTAIIGVVVVTTVGFCVPIIRNYRSDCIDGLACFFKSSNEDVARSPVPYQSSFHGSSSTQAGDIRTDQRKGIERMGVGFRIGDGFLSFPSFVQITADEGIVMNNSEFRIRQGNPAGTPCGDEGGTTLNCGYDEDLSIPDMKLRVWKKNNEIIALNPIGPAFDFFGISKVRPTEQFTSNEMEMWKDILRNYFSNSRVPVAQIKTGTKVKITKPNGGEIYNVSSVLDIEWESDFPKASLVEIDLLIFDANYPNQPYFSYIFATTTRNTGLYRWSVPKVAKGTEVANGEYSWTERRPAYKIHVNIFEEPNSQMSFNRYQYYDESDTLFSILP